MAQKILISIYGKNSGLVEPLIRELAKNSLIPVQVQVADTAQVTDILVCTDEAGSKDSLLKWFYQTQTQILVNLEDHTSREALEIFQKDKDKKNYPNILDYSKTKIFYPLGENLINHKLLAAAIFQLGLYLQIDPEIIQKNFK